MRIAPAALLLADIGHLLPHRRDAICADAQSAYPKEAATMTKPVSQSRLFDSDHRNSFHAAAERSGTIRRSEGRVPHNRFEAHLLVT
jgi:hypothetical protein